jgi:hypothetical protein
VQYRGVLSSHLKSSLDRVLAALSRELGENLYSCSLYGSAVRGNLVEGVSDINLLIVLNSSDPQAHDAVGRALAGHQNVDPFILGRPGFERSVRAFAAKFASIKRNYRVIHGADPLAEIVIEPALERFLCEQALRNLRLRLAFSYTMRARHKSYVRFLSRSVTPIFLRLSEILRLSGRAYPEDFAGRVPLMQTEFGGDAGVLRDLLDLKRADGPSEARAEEWHRRVFPVLDAALAWIEREWPQVLSEHKGV